VASQFIASILCFIYLFVRYKDFRLHKEDFKMTFDYIMEHLKLGLPLAFQFSILGIGIIVMQAGIIAFDINPTISSYPAENGIGAAYKLSNLLMCPLMALGTSMLSFMGQNLGAKDHKRIKDGFNASMIIGLVCFGAVFIIGLLFTINGAYLYIFLSKDKITSETIRYGNDYMFVMLPFEITLMSLFIMRNACQGIEKSLWPFLAGVGELVARCLVCFFLPALINGGSITSAASEASYIALCFADPIAWVFADLIMLYPVIKYIYKNKNLTVK
jgi:Na+-driven multidrug efflux pump